MNKDIITGEYRDINSITQAFKITLAQAQRMALSYVVQLGQLITEAKELLDDGKEFERWLSEEVGFKKATAYNYMKIAAEYGGQQVNLFGEVKGKLGSLSYSQALALLAIPADEREEFAETNKVEDMSARELKQAIAERDEARRERDTAEREKEDALWEKQNAEDEKAAAEKALAAEKASRPDVSAIEKRAETAEENSKRLEKLLKDAENSIEKVQNEVKAKEAEQTKLTAELEKLRKNPEIPDELLGKLSAEAAEKAKTEADTRYSQRIELLEAERDAASASAEKLRKQLQQSNEDVTVFRTYLTDAQTILNKLSGICLKIDGRDAELAGKLRAAEKAILMQTVQKL